LNALDEQQKPETEEGDAQPAKTYTSRQTLLCSATLTTGIEQLSEISLKHPSMSSIVFLCFKDYGSKHQATTCCCIVSFFSSH
jgi:superfamily II DNA/RNA helicase